MRDLNWQGDPEDFQLGDDVPHFSHGTRVIPASANPSPPAKALLACAMRCFPNLRDVIVDRGVSNKRDFIRAAHELGLNVAFDYNPNEVAHPKTLKFGRNANTYYEHAGSLFPGWLDESVVTPPAIRGHKTLDDKTVTDQELQQWYIDRAKLACTVNQKFPDGTAQHRSPEAAGRIRTTRNMHRANADAPDYSGIETYPEQYFNVPLQDRERLQTPPWPTPAWEASYGRREIVETGNAQDKDEGGFSEESCRVASFVAHIITATLIAVINNLEEARRYPIHQEQQRRKAEGKKAAAKANGTEQRNGTPTSQPATEEPTPTPAADIPQTPTKAQTNGTAAYNSDNEQPDKSDPGATADITTAANSNGHSSHARRSDRHARATTPGPTNSSNRRGRNKRRRQPQQRQQTPPNGRSPPLN